MPALNTRSDGTGTPLWQLGDPGGRTVVRGPTGIATPFRFLVNSSGVNRILNAPGAGLRYRIYSLFMQNQDQGIGVSGILRAGAGNDWAGVRLPPLGNYDSVFKFQSDLNPWEFPFNAPLELLETSGQTIGGWGIYSLDNF